MKSANFQVLHETRMPAALIEYGFMDDPSLREARLMLDVDFHKECAKETAQGICEYFGVKYVSRGTTVPPDQPSGYDNNSKYHRLLNLKSPMMSGEDVKKLQKRLEVPADGIFGPLTKQAVMNWQRVHDEKGRVVSKGKGLAVDGIVGSLTWNALFT